MVISQLHLDRIEKNLSFIQEYLGELRRFSNLDDIQQFIKEIVLFLEKYKKALEENKL